MGLSGTLWGAMGHYRALWVSMGRYVGREVGVQGERQVECAKGGGGSERARGVQGRCEVVH